MKKILVYVQHLLGVGHLHRTALITQELGRAGFDVTVVSGGVAEDSLDFGRVTLIQLPAIKTDAAFSALYDESGRPLDDEFKRLRARKLLAIYNRIQPDMVLIETYPFGRRQMRFELLPLLELIKFTDGQRPLVASSIRDVIQPKSKPKRSDEVVDLVSRYFDMIFVHGDRSFISFDRTFPQARHFKDKIFYTGYVTKLSQALRHVQRQQNRILVSAGGGAVGEKLYQTAIEVSKLPQAQSSFWHVLVGHNLSNQCFNQLQKQQTSNLRIERNRTDFLRLLSECAISVSQGGYNTMMDVLVTQTPAIIIPFEGEAECEQLIRAQAFEQQGRVCVIRENNLSCQTLLEAVSKTSMSQSEQTVHVMLDGARQMAQIVKSKLTFHDENR